MGVNKRVFREYAIIAFDVLFVCLVLYFVIPTSSEIQILKSKPLINADFECLRDPSTQVRYSENKIIEDSAFPYPIYIERLSANLSLPTKYWILFTEHPKNKGQALPAALLRDDDGDSGPDVALLFSADQEDPVEIKMNEFSYKGCSFWSRPITHFLNEALQKKSWHLGLARDHAWVSFLDKLKSYELEVGLPVNQLSVLNESDAHKLFELLNLSALTTRKPSNQSIEADFEGTQHRTLKMLSWLGVRHRTMSMPKFTSIWIDGLKTPVQPSEYKAPMFYVKRAGQREETAVFDVLLFNDWASEVEWSQRVASPAISAQ